MSELPGVSPRSRRSNPFSTRFVRPGAVDYLFEPGESAEQLVGRLAAADWRGQIVGPHGSGKSTLLAHLAEPLTAAGRTLWKIALHDGQRHMPRGWKQAVRADGANQIVVDGYEQLSRLGRLAARFHCLRHGWGLLVTAHQDAGLPTLCSTCPNLETTQAIAARVQSNCEDRLGPEVVAACYAAARGDVRETLFLLYDRWQLNRPSRR